MNNFLSQTKEDEMKAYHSIFTSIMTGLMVLGLISAFPVTGHAYSLTADLYMVAANPSGIALDQFGNDIGGTSVVEWSFEAEGLGSANLSIVAEGVDRGRGPKSLGEIDRVYFNGFYLGTLVQQDFYSPRFNIQSGEGALEGVTALTTSMFDVTQYLTAGSNTVQVVVDPANWVCEIETSMLSVEESFMPISLAFVGDETEMLNIPVDTPPVPEPSTLILLGIGAILLGVSKVRNRRQ